MDEKKLLWIGVALCVSTITYLSLSQRQRDVIAQRLLLRGRRSSSADTPPRSLSPEKKVPTNAAPKTNEYAAVFPPSQRDLLRDIAPTLSSAQREKLGSLDFNEKTFENNIIGWEEDFRTCDESKYIASGFSVNEIKAIGDFPDFELLTGVPNPDPYKEFDINKAVPRPYRPFRWPYHQTMCKTCAFVPKLLKS